MKRLLFFLFTMVMFIACNNAPEITYNQQTTTGPTYITTGTTNKHGDYAITFKNTSKRQKIRHISVSGTGYDDFSLFTTCDTGVVMNPYLVEYNGNGWAYAGVGTQDTVWFYSACQEYDFFGVIPSDATTTLDATNKTVEVENIESFIVKEAIEDSPKEFLYSTAVLGRNDYPNGVDLNFKHGNAKVYFNFESDDAATKLVDFTPYTSGTPAVPAVPPTTATLTEKRKMFDLMSEGETVGYPLTSQQETLGGYYTGMLGNFMNLDPNHGSLNYVTNERMAELMPLVNAQFEYVDADGNDISNVDWVYGQDRKNKVFLRFAPGVSAADFIAGDDAFWTNLTPTEKAALQNYHDSGCRVLRINQNANGDYFAWGESYGTYMNTTSRYFTILVGGTPGTPEIPATGVKGFILLAATSSIGDGSDAIISEFAETADATISLTSATLYQTVTGVDRYIYDIPASALSVKTASPSVLFSVPVKKFDEQGFTVKFSYVYKGDTAYDVRAYVPADKCVWKEGKKYTYNIKIQGLGNGKMDYTEADKDDPVVGGSNVIDVINVDVTDYTEGDSYDIVIKH